MPSLPAGIEFIPVGSLTLSSDRRVLDVTFAGARAFDPADPCSADYSAWTHVGEVLDVGIWESKRPPGAHGCDAVGHGRELRATLDRPFAGTVWRDVSAPFIHFLAAPPGLATIDVPDGWQLIDEGDLEDSPTGRWQRTYAPRPDAGSEERLTIYQSFDGPVNVTGGEELGAQRIGDRFGTSYRHAPSGDIVLVWPWGAGELALSANERAIPMPALIRIAETAR